MTKLENFNTKFAKLCNDIVSYLLSSLFL